MQVAAAAPAPVQGLLEHRRTISQLVAALPRTSERVQVSSMQENAQILSSSVYDYVPWGIAASA